MRLKFANSTHIIFNQIYTRITVRQFNVFELGKETHPNLELAQT